VGGGVERGVEGGVKSRLVSGSGTVKQKPSTRISFGAGFESRRAQVVVVEKAQEEPQPAP
jgi:hypothetical protein